MSDLTRILSDIEQGDPSAAEQLLPTVYKELRRLAAARLASEEPGQTLQATALVHEAYLRLVDQSRPQQWDGRAHFFAAAAESMRRILIERARKPKANPSVEHVAHFHDHQCDKTCECKVGCSGAPSLEVGNQQTVSLIELRRTGDFRMSSLRRTVVGFTLCHPWPRGVVRGVTTTNFHAGLFRGNINTSRADVQLNGFA